MAKKKISKGIGIATILLNVLILPGLGTLIASIEDKKYQKTGILQLVLFLIGIPLAFVIIGIPLMIAMWIWALVTSIEVLKNIK